MIIGDCFEDEQQQQKQQLNINMSVQNENDSCWVPFLCENNCIVCHKGKKLVTEVSMYDLEISSAHQELDHKCNSKFGFFMILERDRYKIYKYWKCKKHKSIKTFECLKCKMITDKSNYKKCKKCQAVYFNSFRQSCPECGFNFCEKCGRQSRLFPQYLCTCQYDGGYTNNFYLLLLILFQIIIFPIMVYGQSLVIGVYFAMSFFNILIDIYQKIGKIIFFILIIPIIIIYIITYSISYFVYMIPKSIYVCILEIYELVSQMYRNSFIE